MQHVVPPGLVRERRPDQGVLAVGGREADNADRPARDLLDRIHWKGERPLFAAVLEHSHRRVLLDQGKPGSQALARGQERAIEVRDHSQEAVQVADHVRIGMLIDRAGECL